MSEQPAAHDVYRHREDGLTCILVEDGTWFIPYDVGGEGVTCERQHGSVDTVLLCTRIRRLQLAVAKERRRRREQAREERGMGWDRAHTMLCHDTYPKCQHRNPWMRTRGTT